MEPRTEPPAFGTSAPFRTSNLEVGIGLRPRHYHDVLATRPKVSWFEVISENYLGARSCSGNRPLEILEQVRQNYPVVLHGVSLNVGSTDPLRLDYLSQLKWLIDRIGPAWVSDHLCWTGIEGENLHDLLPLPYTEDVVRYVAERVAQVQDVLGRQILLENVSSYLTYRHSQMLEWEFLAELASKADCGILLDVNNVHVSATNHGFDRRKYLDGVPPERVGQIHLAGHDDGGKLLIDTHDRRVAFPVWELYRYAIERFGPVPTLIEWDDKIPALPELLAEAGRARQIQESVLGRKQAHRALAG
jgi:uncharacterized protein